VLDLRLPLHDAYNKGYSIGRKCWAHLISIVFISSEPGFIALCHLQSPSSLSGPRGYITLPRGPEKDIGEIQNEGGCGLSSYMFEPQ
jgi:hypothetical protein